jgi:hypothetical protein
MSYTVLWLPDAENELARIWIEANDRQAVTRAAELLDGELTEHPNDVGESRSSNRRIAFEKPLIIAFRIDQFAGVVVVQSVRSY